MAICCWRHVAKTAAISFVAGSLQKARCVLNKGLALYDPAYHETHAYRFSHDPAISLHGYLSKTLWLMGYPELARNQSDALAY